MPTAVIIRFTIIVIVFVYDIIIIIIVKCLLRATSPRSETH